MNNIKIKQFLLILVTIFCAMIPAFFLTACNVTVNVNSNELLNVYLVIDGEENRYSQETSIDVPYGVDTDSIINRISFYFEFRDGTKKNSKDFDIEHNAKDKELYDYINSLGEYSEKYYLGSVAENGGETKWTEIANFPLNQNRVLDAGSYKIVYQIAGRELKLQITVSPTDEDQTNLRIAVVPNNSSNYTAASKFKYGCPTYKNEFNPETYTSNYKVWVYDSKTSKVVSGTNVTNVYAIPVTAPENRTIESYWDGVSDITITAGDNLVDKYNEIDSENAFSKKQMQQFFLSSYASGNEITLSRNNGQAVMYDDDTMVVYTESVKPGNYYLIAEYADKNHNRGYTTPKKSNSLTIEKGDFVWKNTISNNFQDYNETEATNFINSLSFKIDYYFNTYTENPLFSTQSSKALSMDFLKTLNIDITSTYPDIPDGQGGTNSWHNYMQSSPVCEGGRGAFGWYDLVLTGKKMNRVNINRLDCADMENGGSITLQAKLKFNDETILGEYYHEDDTIYPVTVTLHKGVVAKPVSYEVNDGYINFEYNGASHSPSIILDENYLKFYNITGTPSEVAVGDNYKIRYTLKDSVNYVIDDCNDDYIEFNWRINKMTLDEYELIDSSRCTYGGQIISEDDGNGGVYYSKHITYNPNAENNRTIIVTVSSEKYNLIKAAAPDTRINFTLTNDKNPVTVTGASISQEGLEDGQFALTFTGCQSNDNTVDILVSVDETSVSNAYTPLNWIQIFIHKLPYTSEQLDEIYGTAFEKNNENNYVATFNVEVDEERKISSAAVPGVSTALGAWKIYYEENNNLTEVIPTETVLPINVGRLVYRFVPEDNMYQDINSIYVDLF